MRKLIIDGNDVYEIDLDCLKKKGNSIECENPISIKFEEEQDDKKGTE